MLLMEPTKLTKRQREVLDLLADDGMSDAEIARELDVATVTIKHHLRGLKDKLGARNRASLLLRAVKAGLIKI